MRHGGKVAGRARSPQPVKGASGRAGPVRQSLPAALLNAPKLPTVPGAYHGLMKPTRDAEGSDLIAILASAGHRVTGSRRAVARLIAARDGAFEAADLIADSQRLSCGAARATIFRTLEVLVALGAMERLDLPNGRHTYVRCETSRHHHHLVCTSCGRSVDLEELGIAAVVTEAERRTGYRIDRHRVELFGLCPACRKSAE
jgi:Fur family ferric uptake transcriptional regulator